MSCADSQKREDDADTFAIALLTYDIPGETEASRRALERVLGRSEAASDPDEAIGYGYPQAIRHGFALAGLSNKIFENWALRITMLNSRSTDVCRTVSLKLGEGVAFTQISNSSRFLPSR